MAGQLRVDEITDEAGTGSPDFVNGVKIAGVTQSVALPDPGTAGQGLVSTGTAWVSGAVGGNYIAEAYTGPATWTKSAGLKAVKVTVIGGGGGGGNTPSPLGSTFGTTGGGGGALVFAFIPAPSIPGPVTVTVGAGGAVATAGGTSSFGTLATCTGGAGGKSAPAPFTNVAGGVGTTAFGLAIDGGDGLLATPRQQEFGGQSAFLSLAHTPLLTGNGVPGKGFGTGGSGASGGPVTPFVSGGTGAPGLIIVEEFY